MSMLKEALAACQQVVDVWKNNRKRKRAAGYGRQGRLSEAVRACREVVGSAEGEHLFASPEQIALVREKYANDDLTIDDDAMLSGAAPDCWVSAWVWLEGGMEVEEAKKRFILHWIRDRQWVVTQDDEIIATFSEISKAEEFLDRCEARDKG